jgi:hypothetical protein
MLVIVEWRKAVSGNLRDVGMSTDTSDAFRRRRDISFGFNPIAEF